MIVTNFYRFLGHFSVNYGHEKNTTNKYSTMYDQLEKNCIDKQPSKRFRVQVSSLNQILWFRPFSVDQSYLFQATHVTLQCDEKE